MAKAYRCHEASLRKYYLKLAYTPRAPHEVIYTFHILQFVREESTNWPGGEPSLLFGPLIHIISIQSRNHRSLLYPLRIYRKRHTTTQINVHGWNGPTTRVLCTRLCVLLHLPVFRGSVGLAKLLAVNLLLDGSRCTVSKLLVLEDYYACQSSSSHDNKRDTYGKQAPQECARRSLATGTRSERLPQRSSSSRQGATSS